MEGYKASEGWVSKCDDGVITDALKTACACIESKKHFKGGGCIGKTTLNGARALRKKKLIRISSERRDYTMVGKHSMASMLRTHSKVNKKWETLGMPCAALLMTPNPPPRALRLYAPGEFQFRLSTQKPGESCCLPAYACEEGFNLGWVYARTREVNAGFMSDSANLGGKRVKGVSQMGQEGTSKSAEHEDDTAAVMLCCSWWNMLKDIEDVQPNAAKTKGSIPLTMITPTQLYEEYKAAMQDDLVGFVSEDKFRHIWGEKYDSVKIVKHQNVNSKCRVRPRLRALARGAMGGTKHERELVNHLRRVFRDNTHAERAFYWDARFLASANPRTSLCTIQDGATQEHFRTPQTANGDAQGHSMSVKLVGQIVHGQLFVFYLVPQWVSDDANLVTTLLLRTQELSIEVRKGKGLPAYAPPLI